MIVDSEDTIELQKNLEMREAQVRGADSSESMLSNLVISRVDDA